MNRYFGYVKRDVYPSAIAVGKEHGDDARQGDTQGDGGEPAKFWVEVHAR